MRRFLLIIVVVGFAAVLGLGMRALAETPFGGAIGGPFDLVDHHGVPRSEADPQGRPQLVFFGYANCEGICSHVLPTLGGLTDHLANEGLAVTPLMITIDPELDTVDALGPALAGVHPALLGLTGSKAALARARKAYQVEIETLFEDPYGQPVYAHGSFIYLVDASGEVLTLLPPILGVERMSEIVHSYVESPLARGRG